jgi:putative transposase
VKFSCIAKHRGIWPADWMCGALGVSRGGLYAWLKRPRSRRSRSDEEIGAKVRASFFASDRTYGTRRAWLPNSEAYQTISSLNLPLR